MKIIDLLKKLYIHHQCVKIYFIKYCVVLYSKWN